MSATSAPDPDAGSSSASGTSAWGSTAICCHPLNPYHLHFHCLWLGSFLHDFWWIQVHSASPHVHCSIASAHVTLLSILSNPGSSTTPSWRAGTPKPWCPPTTPLLYPTSSTRAGTWPSGSPPMCSGGLPFRPSRWSPLLPLSMGPVLPVLVLGYLCPGLPWPLPLQPPLTTPYPLLLAQQDNQHPPGQLPGLELSLPFFCQPWSHLSGHQLPWANSLNVAYLSAPEAATTPPGCGCCPGPL